MKAHFHIHPRKSRHSPLEIDILHRVRSRCKHIIHVRKRNWESLVCVKKQEAIRSGLDLLYQTFKESLKILKCMLSSECILILSTTFVFSLLLEHCVITKQALFQAP